MRFIVALALVALFSLTHGAKLSPKPTPKLHVGAMFVLGDSGLDVGTNNYIPNSLIKANIPPYGSSFFINPTGRWSDGRIFPDFLAEALDMTYVQPYLNSDASHRHGANFASSGSGFLDTTNANLGVIPLSKQLQQLTNLTQEYKNKMGEKAATKFLNDSVLVFGMGANDVAENIGRVNSLELQQMMMSSLAVALRKCYKMGIRKFIVMGLPPLGCAPSAKYTALIHSGGFLPSRGCVSGMNTMIQTMNTQLETVVKNVRMGMEDAKFVFLNPYDLVMSLVNDPGMAGIENVAAACCGGGPFKAAAFCGHADRHARSGIEYPMSVCNDPSKYLYWDANHPTQAAYAWMFKNYWYGRQDTDKDNNSVASLFSNYIVNPPLSM